MTPVMLFTIDVEEFGLPAEHGIPLEEEAAYALGAQGLERIARILDRHGVRATLFTTLAFARRYRADLAALAGQGHELGLHAVEHRHDYRAMPPEEARSLLGGARAELQATFGAPIDGYRANRFRSPPRSVLKAIGFRWTSNLHPTWVPGAYDHRQRPRTIHEDEGLLEVPVSVTPRLRLPVSWFWMRNFGYLYLRATAPRASRGTGYLHLYIHPWEAADLPRLSGLPLLGRLSVRRTGRPFLALLDRFLGWCARSGLESRTISAHLRQLSGVTDP